MIPHAFSKHPIPEDIPEELERVIQDLSATGNAENFLKKSFDYITQNWGGHRYQMFFYPLRIIETNISKIIHTQGYLHCTTMNYFLRIMLVKSGYYLDSQIQEKWTHTWYITPHQYLHITLDNGSQIDIDPWSYQFGIPYGKYGSGFSSMKIFSNT